MSEKNHPASLQETRTQGTVTFPCTFYTADASLEEEGTPFRTKVHWHDAVEILHFIRGNFQVRIDMDRIDIRDEAFCFVESGKLHSISSDQGYLEEALLFSPSILESPGVDAAEKELVDPLRHRQLTLPLIIDASSPAFAEIRQEYMICQNIFRKDARIHEDQRLLYSASAQLRVKAAVMNMLATLSETGLLGETENHEDHRVEALKDVLRYIRDNYSQKIYLSQLAELMSMNEQYFCRFFRNTMGKTPVSYINEIRIRQASLLLLKSDLPVTQISEDCGFGSAGHFITAFRKATGTTPIQYRKMQRSERA